MRGKTDCIMEYPRVEDRCTGPTNRHARTVRVSGLLAKAEAQFPFLEPREIFEIVAAKIGYKHKLQNHAAGGRSAEEQSKPLNLSMTQDINRPAAQTKVIPSLSTGASINLVGMRNMLRDKVSNPVSPHGAFIYTSRLLTLHQDAYTGPSY